MAATEAVGQTAVGARLRGRPGRLHLASGALVLTSAVGYLLAGAGPLGTNYAPAMVTTHATHAEMLAQSLPMNAAFSVTGMFFHFFECTVACAIVISSKACC